MAAAATTGTVVLYMGVRTLPSITHALVRGGLSPDTPAAAVQWGTHSRQKTVVATVADLAERAKAEGLTAPVISVIGRSVALREEISWFEQRPLFGRSVVVTRATSMPGTLSDLLRARGANVIEAPSTEIEALDQAPIDAAVANLASYEWLVLTSGTAVRFFKGALDRAGLDARALMNTSIAVIGPSTAGALADIGLKADLVPPRFVAESLLETMGDTGEVGGTRILIAGAEDARPLLWEGLRELGATVAVVPTYRSTPISAGPEVEALVQVIDAGEVDLVTFTSASAVTGFVGQVGGDRARKVRAASIGPVTSAAAVASGMEIAIEAPAATIDSLAGALIAHLSASQRPAAR
jgi:uroporphyrinogen III methyltransferase/synthase